MTLVCNNFLLKNDHYGVPLLVAAIQHNMVPVNLIKHRTKSAIYSNKIKFPGDFERMQQFDHSTACAAAKSQHMFLLFCTGLFFILTK